MQAVGLIPPPYFLFPYSFLRKIFWKLPHTRLYGLLTILAHTIPTGTAKGALRWKWIMTGRC